MNCHNTPVPMNQRTIYFTKNITVVRNKVIKNIMYLKKKGKYNFLKTSILKDKNQHVI
jgi:hypothetical protein